MTQIKLSKSSLSQERKNLRNYRQFLPSLDLKRQKLMVEKSNADWELENIKVDISAIENDIKHKLPMLAVKDIPLENYINIESIDIDNENIVGVSLPLFKQINFNLQPYSFFNTPHWIDNFVTILKNLVELRIRAMIGRKRVTLLAKALQTVTQRKNLFEKVLIPKSTAVIRYIQIFLTDNERAAVVRSKIAKKKRQEL